MNSLSLMLGAVYFSFQIYGDFSGYSDIALGTSKLFGIDLLKNFNPKTRHDEVSWGYDAEAESW